MKAAGIKRMTAPAYERLLTNLLVVEALPAWMSNRLKRLVLMPKRHLVEPALAGAVRGLERTKGHSMAAPMVAASGAAQDLRRRVGVALPRARWVV